ncbi:LON peptidase substrate-binding domain-containing protein, partial [Suipraeoptans intestinalis]
MEEKNRILPIVALRGLTILPEMVKHFDVSRDKTMKAVEKAIEENQKVFFVSQKDPAKEDPKEEDLYKIGCIGVVKQVVKLSRKMTRVLVVGEERARLLELETETEYFSGKVEAIPDEYFGKDGELLERTILEEAMLGGAKDIFREYMLKDPKLSKELSTQIDNIGELTQMIDMIAANVPFDFTDAQQLLEAYNVGERYELLIDKMVRHLQILSIKEELQNKVKERMDKHQKEYVLREEMRLIREELGDDSTLTDAEEFQQRLEKLKAPVEVVEKLQKEIKR